MQDQRIARDVGPTDDDDERAVLMLLLESPTPWPWSLQELALELGSELRTTDAVARLHAAGLAHSCHEFVWATRAAARWRELADGG
jgi:hypothetical protein